MTGAPENFKVTRVAAVWVFRALAWLATTSGFAGQGAIAGEPLLTTASASGAQDVMAELSAQLFAVLDKEPPSIRHNADRVRPLVGKLLAPHFDTEYAARLVLGQHWRDATPDQRR